MTRLEKKRLINQKYRAGCRYYAYCNATVCFFVTREEAENFALNRRFLSRRLDENFNERSFYAKKFSDSNCEEILDDRIRFRLD